MLVKIFRREFPLKIVLFLLKNPNSKHKDICENLSITSSLLSYHLNKLADQGIVDIPTSGEGFKIRNKKEIVMILRRYQLRSILERFTDTWDNFD